MGKEIEHKFLVKNIDFLKDQQGTLYIQSYLSISKNTVRARIAGSKGFLTIKGKRKGNTRDEYEYEIPLKDAKEIIEKFCIKPVIIKIRYLYKFKGFTWEIDVFQKENKGLIIAEIELKEEKQEFPLPPWISKEVTGDKRYNNSKLIRNPFRNWR
jgi:adenylate cyclase